MTKLDINEVLHNLDHANRLLLGAQSNENLFNLPCLIETIQQYVLLNRELDTAIPILLDRHQHDALRKDANWLPEVINNRDWPYEGKLIMLKERM